MSPSSTGQVQNTSERIADNAALNREVVHDHEEVQILSRTIVICVDDSIYSEHAYEWMLENIARVQTDLIIFINCRQMTSIPAATGFGDVTIYLSEIERENRQRAHELLLAYAKDAKAHGYHVRALALRSGSVKEELVREVQQLNANVVIIGSRGMGMVKRTFLGSVSDYLVHHVHAPVIVVRMTEDEEKNYKHEKKVLKQLEHATPSVVKDTVTH